MIPTNPISELYSYPFDLGVFLASLPTKPGIYQMFQADGQVLYVGKAGHLKNRVSSYFHQGPKDIKTQRLLTRIHHIEVTITPTPHDALLLENILIKKHQPPYNILLKDHKSYPYIFFSEEPFSQVSFHRGAKKRKGYYYGPCPSGRAVREMLTFLYQGFQLRQCDPAVFKSRTRPCLQYQIGRCSAPCVGYISEEAYGEQVQGAKQFLQGNQEEVIKGLTRQMQKASEEQAYELASTLRDQIAKLRQVQAHQLVEASNGDIDVFGVAVMGSIAVIQLLMIRQGLIFSTHFYTPKIPLGADEHEVLEGFLGQYYLHSLLAESQPTKILLPWRLADETCLQEALKEKMGKTVSFIKPTKRVYREWLKMVHDNTHQHLNQLLASQYGYAEQFFELQKVLNLKDIPERLVCFDVSHHQGDCVMASAVVFEHQGPIKAKYRRFSIPVLAKKASLSVTKRKSEHSQAITAGDDYAAMEQVLTRYGLRLKKEGLIGPVVWVIDGGKGQLQRAIQVVKQLDLPQMSLVAIAKGIERKPGLETLWIPDQELPLALDAHSVSFKLLQQCRDEAHRFALSGHRNQKRKAVFLSELDGVSGLGSKKKRALLTYFGGMQAVQAASIQDLTKAPGIGPRLGGAIHKALHGE